MSLSTEEGLLIAKFKAEIHCRSADIDPNDEEDWHSISLGWALGKGLLPDDAMRFADYIRYQTELG